jgi:hypothetical protein
MQGPDDRPYLGGKALNEVIGRFTASGVFVAPRKAAAAAGNLASGGL